MKLSKYTLLYILLVGIVILTGCSDHLFDDEKQPDSNRILLSGDIEQLAVTRVNDNGFCDGDKMGVYIVDYEGDYPGTLKVSGNRADNVQHTFDESQNKWNSAYDIYWKDKHTHVDIYGYYPIANPESIEDCSFEVQKDQSKESKDGEMGGYESSDFLWGKVADVTPTANTIRLPLTHRMSNAKVTLVKGSGFTDEEWANTEKTVLTANVARKASINLSTGEVKVAGSVENTATIPSKHNNEWRTIVIPQTIPAGTTLFSITIGGEPYKFSKSGDFTYQAGKMMNFGIKGSMLITLLRHCDRIKVACLAQLVNVIAPIFTKTGGGAFEQTIFYPFMHLSNFGRGAALRPLIDCPKYDCKEFTDVPYLEAIATYDEEREEAVIFCVNKSLDESALLTVNMLDFDGYKPVEFISMDGYDKKAENGFDAVTVKPHKNELPEADGKTVTAELKPFSWNVIRLAK